MASLGEALSGISGILVTPFDADDALRPEALQPIVDRAIAAGVGALVANGNTGEFYALSLSEAERMVAAAAEIVAGRVPLIGGVGRGLPDALALARASHAAGAAALMVHQPPDPFVAPSGVVAYVERIAEAADGLPLLLYIRNPGIGVDAIARLTAIESVVGVKWASPTPLALAEAMRASRDGLAWSCGLAETWTPPLYAVGARGFTSGLINVLPHLSVMLLSALERSDYPAARAVIARVEPFETLRAGQQNGANVSVVKAALHAQGLDCGAVRPPGAWPLSPEVRAAIAAFLEAQVERDR